MFGSQPLVGVLVPIHPGPMLPPELRPIGRAALQLSKSGLGVVFGDRLIDGRLVGHRLEEGAWQEGEFEVDVLYDRFPSQSRPQGYGEIMAARGPLPMGNPPSFTALLRDKIKFQALMEAKGIKMPPIVTDPEAFEAELQGFGRAFLKPRYGGRGRGISVVQPGDPLPARGEGAVPGVEEPLFLQRAVSPPPGWAGVSVRVLLQRDPEHGGEWRVFGNVVRRSLTDPVVNVYRGAEAQPASRVLGPLLCAELHQAALDVAIALKDLPDIHLAVEMGVDLVLNQGEMPVLIEANSRPRGRLEALAIAMPEAFAQAHIDACARPMGYLAWRLEQGP